MTKVKEEKLNTITNKKQLPERWVETTLGEVVELIGGGTPKTTITEYWNGDIPWLSIVDFNNDSRWVSKTEKTITKNGLKNSSTNLLNAGNLIISARGTVGELVQLRIPMAFNQSCYGLREKENISDNNFLYYLTKFSLKQFLRNVHGAVFDTITRKTFDSIKINLPPLPQQKAIAKILSAFDDKIELLREQNETLEKIGQEIFKEWFGKYKIDDELPEGWRVGNIGEKNFAEVIGSGIKEFNGEKIYLATADVSGNTVTNLSTKITFQNRPSRANMQPIENSIWFAKMKDSRKLLMFDDFSKNEIESYILSTGFAGIKTTELFHYYMWLFILSEKFDDIKNNLAGGAVQVALNNTNLKSVKIIIPSDKILKKLNKIVKPLFEKIKNNSKQIQTLSKARDTLLPKLMKGEMLLNNLTR